MDNSLLLQTALLVFLIGLVSILILVLIRPDSIGALQCMVGLHLWSKWGEPAMGKQIVGYAITQGQALQQDVQIQERQCLRCNLIRYRTI